MIGCLFFIVEDVVGQTAFPVSRSMCLQILFLLISFFLIFQEVGPFLYIFVRSEFYSLALLFLPVYGMLSHVLL